MEKQHKDAVWVPHAEIEPEVCGKGVKRRILAYSKDAMCVENTFETGGVGAMHCHPHTQVTYIVSGRYQPGDKLPSVRDLAAEASVNPNTMQKAFAELERTGLVYSRRTSGRFITEDCHMIEQLKTSLATEKMEEFLAQMRQLGFQNDEILSLMNQTMKGEKQ